MNRMPQEPFAIRATSRIVYKDEAGQITKVFEIGDEIVATAATETYWVTAMGGVYFHEAELVDDRPGTRDKPA